MNLNIKLILRCLAGLSMAGMYGHNFWTIDSLFGLTISTILFLTALLLFYFFLFMYHFYGIQKVEQIRCGNCKKRCHLAQVTILVLNGLIAIYDFSTHENLTIAMNIWSLIFEEVFILFPEVVIAIIATFFEEN